MVVFDFAEKRELDWGNFDFGGIFLKKLDYRQSIGKFLKFFKNSLLKLFQIRIVSLL